VGTRLTMAARLAGLTAVVALLGGCLSLDPYLFSGEEISSYKLDAYTGERECASYITQRGPLPQSEIHALRISSGSETLAGFLLNADSVCSPADTLILYFHGKSDHIDLYWARTRMLHEAGYPVVVIDYRGFGLSTGEPTEDGLYEDGAASLRYIRERLGDPHVVVYSYSLGTLVGCKVTADQPDSQIIKLVLEAPIGSVTTIVDDGTWLPIPGEFVTTYSGDNTERIERVLIPLLWLHGTADGTLGRETNGTPIWNNYPGSDGAYVKVEGGGHTNLPQTLGSDYNRYIETVRYFVQGEHRNHAEYYTGFKP
jgi:pimeloyl-ACP methyl ester carboxylesterase